MPVGFEGTSPREIPPMENSAHDDQHGHADHHAPFQAHHFDTMEQQFQAGKLGMWIFLVTEILLFGGLFCAYAAYRANHPQIFVYAAEEFLDKTLGAINTAVLIFSSFTMAWGVRCAQLNRQRSSRHTAFDHSPLRCDVPQHQVRRVQAQMGGRTVVGAAI